MSEKLALPEESYDSQIVAIRPILHKIACRWVRGDYTLAEDLVQEAIVQALRARDRYTNSHPFKAWMVHIMKCVKYDHFKSWKYRKVVPLTVEEQEIMVEMMMAPDDQHTDLEVKQFLASLSPAEMDEMHRRIEGLVLDEHRNNLLPKRVKDFLVGREPRTKKVRKAYQPKTSRELWSDERVMELRSLMAKGFSGQKIADVMGVTRNMVIGKISRLKKEEEDAGTVQGADQRDGEVARLPVPAAPLDGPRSRGFHGYTPDLMAAVQLPSRLGTDDVSEEAGGMSQIKIPSDERLLEIVGYVFDAERGSLNSGWTEPRKKLFWKYLKTYWADYHHHMKWYGNEDELLTRLFKKFKAGRTS